MAEPGIEPGIFWSVGKDFILKTNRWTHQRIPMHKLQIFEENTIISNKWWRGLQNDINTKINPDKILF